MQLSTFGRLATLVALSLPIAGHDSCRATPLSQDTAATASDAGLAQSLSDTEIVSTRSLRPDDGLLSPQAASTVVQNNFKSTSGEDGNAWIRNSVSGFELGTSAGSPIELFRSLVNIPRGHPRNAAPRKGAPAEEAFTLGPEAREWVDDAIRGIVNSVVELRANETGRTTFSVLGMGDFGIMLSADRNELALVSGEDVLITAHRGPPSAASAQAADAYQNVFHAPAAAVGAARDHSLQRMLHSLQEAATHPLSLLVYAIIIGFVVLWQVLNAQTKRYSTRHARTVAPEAPRTASLRSSGKRRRSHRSRKR